MIEHFKSGFIKQAVAAGIPEDKANALYNGMSHRENKKHQIASSLRNIAAGGALGGGMGLMGISRSALSPEDANKLDVFSNLPSRWHPDTGNDRRLLDYIDTASTAATAKPFGMSTFEFMKKVRSNPLMYSKHVPKAIRNNAWDKDSDAEGLHYHEFANGPIAAYRQLIKEVPGENNIAAYLDPSSAEYGKIVNGLHNKVDSAYIDSLKRSNPQLDLTGDKILNIPAIKDLDLYGDRVSSTNNFSKKLEEKFNEFKSQLYPNEESLNSRKYTSLYPAQEHAAQMDELGKFDTWLSHNDPTLHIQKSLYDQIAGASATDNTPLYKTLIDTLKTTVHDIPHYAGMGLAAAGGGYLLHQLIKSLRDKKNSKIKESIPQLLTTPSPTQNSNI